MDRQLLATLSVFTILLAFCGISLYVVSPFLPAIGWGAVISVITFPLYRKFTSKTKLNRNITAGLMTAIVAIAICIPAVMIISVLSTEIAALYRFIEASGAEGIYSQFKPLLESDLFVRMKNTFEPLLGQVPADIGSSLLPAIKKISSIVAGYSASIMKNMFGLFFHLFFMTIILFFMYRDGEALLKWFWGRIPVAAEHRETVENTTQRVFSAVIFGIFLTCIVQGILGGLGFWVAGLPSPILSGSLMMLAAFIPVVGTALIWLPGAIYLIMQGSVGAGVALIIWGVVAVGSIDNLIRPLFISGRAKLPILPVAIGALGGLLAFGLIGVVFGPLILALPIALFESMGKGIEPSEP